MERGIYRRRPGDPDVDKTDVQSLAFVKLIIDYLDFLYWLIMR
jgi:hypothetical protein